jgi:FlaA1/EpsC-like NDP-sugar epimerase
MSDVGRGQLSEQTRILIVGHGTAGRALAVDILARGGHVVGFLDDHSRAEDVLGTLSDVNEVIRKYAVAAVYFAIPSVDSVTVRDFLNTIDVDSVEIAIIPRTYQILTRDTVNINDLTDVDVLDLVGRQPVKHDLLSSTEFIKGKRILVTGAAGSIGSRLVGQLAAMAPEVLVCIDWWENGMFFLGRDLASQPHLKFHIADVKNEQAMERLFSTYEPDIVFHAAAYKHVPLMQKNPIEAINNNVGGTLNVLKLAAAHRAANVVYISTDKAVNPVNVMGATKRIGELILDAIAATTTTTRYNAVRFGNVIESNGSVMQIFRRQIEQKLPLTVTDPDITRFFMTIDEASQLVIQSAVIGNSTETFVLDMGEPVKILDLARSLVRAVDPTLTIKITGLRPGEKMYEELSYEPDAVDHTTNPKIFAVREERVADAHDFMERVESLLHRSLDYAVTEDEAIAELRTFGFDIK